MRLLTDNEQNLVSKYPVVGFEEAIAATGEIQVVNNRMLLLGKVLNRFLLAIHHQLGPHRRSIRVPSKSTNRFFSILVGPYFAKCLPYFLTSGDNCIYLMDAWPASHNLIHFYIDQLHIHTVFLSSSQVTEAFTRARQDVHFFWLPEAINPEHYSFRPTDERDIDVLQFGRKYDPYHERILEPLQRSGRTYLYEKQKGKIVFDTREGFLDGLSRSKISICVPASVTHPEKSGGISTMTTRYLQSMAAKCIVVGFAPDEMKRLFGYDPVVPIDTGDPYGQLDDILRHFQDYTPLVERNYSEILEHHTWKRRWLKVKELLSADTFAGR